MNVKSHGGRGTSDEPGAPLGTRRIIWVVLRLPGHGACGLPCRLRRGLFGGERRGGVVARRL